MPRIQSLLDSPVEVNGDVLTSLTKDMPKFLDVKEALDFHDAGIGEIARTVSTVMKYGATDQAKLAAARLAAELRGEAKGKNSNTINFIISDTNGVNLMAIFNPDR